MVTGNRREAGAGVIEYAGLIVLAALILGALYATGMPARIGTHTQAAICHVFAAAHCDDPASGHPTASGDHDGDGAGRGDDGEKDGHGKKTGGGKGSGDNDECRGFFGCAAHYAREYAGGVYSQFWDDAKDDVHAFADPWGTAKSIIGGIWDHDKEVYGRAKKRWEQGNYAGAIAGGVWDVWKTPYVMIYDSVITDDVKKDWENGDYLHAAGRAVANTAEWFIPGGDAGKAGKAAKGLHGAEKGEKAGREAAEHPPKRPTGKHNGKKPERKKVAACGVPAALPRARPGGGHAVRVVLAAYRLPSARLTFAALPATPISPGCGRYEPSPKHGKTDRGRANRAPTDGQAALDNSTQISPNSTRRVGVDEKNGEIVIFDETHPDERVFHGHVRSWDELSQAQKNALVKAGLTNRRGKIIKHEDEDDDGG